MRITMTATNKARKGGRRAKVRKVKAWAVVDSLGAPVADMAGRFKLTRAKVDSASYVQDFPHYGFRVVPCFISYQVKA